MGGEVANKSVAAAIRGEAVPEGHRSEFSYEDVQGGHGSANIPCLQAATAGWYWFYRDKRECKRVLDAWRGYLDIDVWFTKEPYSSHRYGTWIRMSYEAVRALAKEIPGYADVVSRMTDYLLYELYLTALSSGWTKSRKEHRGWRYPYARGGARSWCGWDGDHGKGSGPPYKHLVEDAAIGHDMGNLLGHTPEANWEVEPILDALESKVRGFNRWEYVPRQDRVLMERFIKVRYPMDELEQHDLMEFLQRIENLKVKAYIPINIVKTTEGVGWLAERSWSSGSTSFMMGKVWYDRGRRGREFPEPWADDYDRHFGWLYSGGKSRRSDPGGEGSVQRVGDQYVFSAWTGPGKCGNGFVPGAEKHWVADGSVQEMSSWANGPRRITLDGTPIWHIRVKDRGRGITVLYPTDAPQPDPGPDPDPDPGPEPEPEPDPGDGDGRRGRGKLRLAQLSLERAEKRWDNPGGPRQATKAIRQIKEALEIRGE